MPLDGGGDAAGCAHCGLPATDGRFCCHGCRAAYELIHRHGLDSYYRYRDTDDAAGSLRDRRGNTRYDDLDRDAFIETHTIEPAVGQRQVTLGLDGIHCAACIWLLENLPRVIPGVVEARADWRRATLRVRWVVAETSLSVIAQTVSELGYEPHPTPNLGREDRERMQERRRLVQLGIAFAAAGNAMLISLSLYLGMFSMMTDSVQTLLRVGSCVVGLVSLVGPGREFFVGALAAIRSRTPHMDLPVALGLSVGGVAGLVNTIRGAGEIYFDTLSMLVFLLLLGRWIQARQQRNAAAAVEVLYRVTPRTARRITGTTITEVPSTVIVAGDHVEVRAGEMMPADGTVIRGRSTVDEKVLTGESQPVSVEPGSSASAGSLNLSATIVMHVDAVGEDTRMGRILALVERSSARRPEIVQLADRVGGWFVAVIVATAMLTLLTWLTIDASVAVDHAVSLLIVACPCALALATPLAISVALGRAAKQQILIKGGDVLQRLSTPGTIWLDKTGTLTQGRMAVLRWEGDDSAKPWVRALERHSAHPVARALTELDTDAETGPDSVREPVVRAVQQSSRGGIEGRVDGHTVVVGNRPFVEGRCDDGIPPTIAAAAQRMLAQSMSPVFIAIDRTVVAVAGVGDPLRSDAKSAVKQLRARGWQVGILSGDHPEIVAHVGRTLGLDPTLCHGGLTPEQKVQRIEQTVNGPSVMIGEGVNDSAALTAASVGIAIRDGAEASLEAAPVYLGSPGLVGVVQLLDGSRATMSAIRRNFVVSLLYNASAVALAAFGLISPLVAAIVMPLSSLSVVGLSLSLRFGSESP